MSNLIVSLVFFLAFVSCSNLTENISVIQRDDFSTHASARGRDRVSVESARELAHHSYLKGCIDILKFIDSSGESLSRSDFMTECRDLASEYRENALFMID